MGNGNIRYRIARIAVAVAVVLRIAKRAGGRAAQEYLPRQRPGRKHAAGLRNRRRVKGTGDSAGSLPSVRALAQAIQLLGTPVGKRGQLDLKDDIKNVALVLVTATVPGAGARQGDLLNCTVSSIGGAKSLAGGQLFITALKDRESIATGSMRLHKAKFISTIRSSRPAQRCSTVAAWRPISSTHTSKTARSRLCSTATTPTLESPSMSRRQLTANNPFQSTHRRNGPGPLNQENIEVIIPSANIATAGVVHVRRCFSLPMLEPHGFAQVVINERAGSIVISGDIEIGTVVITHKNMVIDTVARRASGRVNRSRRPAAKPFRAARHQHQSAAEAQNACGNTQLAQGAHGRRDRNHQRPDRNGKLHGELIIE